MDINLRLTSDLQLALGKASDLGLPLKLNQVLDAKVINTQIILNTLTLKINDKPLTLQSSAPLPLQAGQSLQLQVVKLLPVPELKIITPLLPASASATATTPTVKLSALPAPLAPDKPLSTTSPPLNTTPPRLILNQKLDAQFITQQPLANVITLAVADKQLTLQSPQAILLTSGQALQLQVVRLLPAPEFKILSPSTYRSASASGEPVPLKLLATAPLISTAAAATIDPQKALQTGVRVSATVIGVSHNTLSLQLTTDITTNNTNQQTSSRPASLQILNTPPNISTPSNQPLYSPSNRPLPSMAQPELIAHSQSVVNPPLHLDNKQLRWPEQTIDRQRPPTLAIGSRIELQLLKTDNNRPVFQAFLPTPAAIETTLGDAVKQLFPLQQPATALLPQLQHFLSNQEIDSSVSETLKRLAQWLLRDIPTKQQLLEPTALKQIMAKSGIFLEAQLLATSASAPTATATPIELHDDFKLKLSQFIAQLRQELSITAETNSSNNVELLKASLQKAQGVLAKITLDQVGSLPRDDTPKHIWLMEVPFFNQDTPESLQLVIEQDKQPHHETGQKNWAVSITITPPDLGTIHCKISCYDSNINTRFWSDTGSTVDKINSHLDYLRQQFEQKGLKAGFMDAQQGKPTQSNAPLVARQNILSEKV